MKKKLLFITFITGAFAVSAQTNCTEGLSATGFFDNFTKATELGDSLGGLYFWGEDTLAGDANPNHQAKLTRDTANGELDVLFSQGQGEYIPFGVSFGTTPNGSKAVVDLSADATVEITVTNYSTTAISVALSIEDSLKKMLNTLSTANPNDFLNAYSHAITFNVDANKPKTYTADFTGGYYANYTTSKLENDCNIKLISGLAVTVTNASNTGDPNWYPLVLNNIDISVNSIKLGKCMLSSSTTEIKNNDIAVYPNPVENGWINFSQALNHVNIYNMTGELLLKENNVSKINVSSLSAGIYFIESSKGTSKFIVK